MTRAAPLPPEERRASIIAAIRPLIVERGAAVTTKEIAEAAGIAEGTIFRVFDDKVELMLAVIASIAEPSDLCARIDALDEPTLGGRLLAILTELQRSHREIAGVYTALFTMAPSEAGERMHAQRPDWKRHHRYGERIAATVQTALAPFTAELRVPVEQAAALVTGYALVASRGTLPDGALGDLDAVVDLLLHGIQRKADS